MVSKRKRLAATWLLLGAAAAPGLADVFSSEFFSVPVSEGWELLNQYCEPELWIDEGWYHQQLDLDACPPGPQGGHDSYVRWLTDFNGEPQFFLEFRVQTDGDRSEIPGGAPSVVAMGNFFGVVYHVTVARDLVQFLRDLDLPIWFIEIERGVPHTYRIELYPDRYAFYIDAYLIDEGLPEGPFPAHDSLITWRGKSWYLPCHNAWDYIRYGVIPVDASGDYDSDAEIGLDDFYFFQECLANRRPGINGGPGNDAGPGCRFADFDFDDDVDLHDFAEFQLAFTGGE
ncbi:MAG: hypothetical protein JSU86_04245 [Phycisphaerales bacterium]|nr:MAG: hypothetical protein JSU86_04245 [Phycisphaerales bacterium]